MIGLKSFCLKHNIEEFQLYDNGEYGWHDYVGDQTAEDVDFYWDNDVTVEKAEYDSKLECWTIWCS